METKQTRKSILISIFALLMTLNLVAKSAPSANTAFGNKIKSNTNFQESVTPEMIAEYNTIAKKYTDPGNDIFWNVNEIGRMTYIYRLMSKKQKDEALLYPEIREGVLADSEQYADGRPTPNSRYRNRENQTAIREQNPKRDHKKAIREQNRIKRLERAAYHKENQIERQNRPKPNIATLEVFCPEYMLLKRWWKAHRKG